MPPSIIDLFWRVMFDTALFIPLDLAFHALLSSKQGKERVKNFIRNRRDPRKKLALAALYGVLNTLGIFHTTKTLWEIYKPMLFAKIKTRRKGK